MRKPKHNPHLSTAMRNLIKKIRVSDSQELIQDVSNWRVDGERVNHSTCWKLLQLCLLNEVQEFSGPHRFTLRQEAIVMLEDPDHVPQVLVEMQKQEEDLRAESRRNFE